MKLQTQIPIEKQDRNQIDYESKVLLLGSCFSENIGNKLNYFKFQTLQNPFGILFHPLAIENLITKSINEEVYTGASVFENNNLWQSFEAHSELSSIQKETVIENLNTAVTKTNQFLKEASHLIFTLGTAWVYRHIASDAIVANCHKVPQKKFLKELLSVEEITESLNAIITLVKDINSKANIIFTVSPVRHLKDGFVENTQSKSHLISGIHQVVDKRNQTFYFPSYELMIDELRDYRFYKPDMIHPNEVAIDYIWEKFTEAWFKESAFATMKQVDTIQKGLQHKPFQEASEEHQQFLKKLHEKIETLKNQFSFMQF